MTVVTFSDIARHRRCPYEHMLDSKSGVWRITATECMDLSVRDAVMACEQRRVMERRTVDRDEAMTFYWDSWDRHYQDVRDTGESTLGLIKFGERCIDNYLRMRHDQPMTAVNVCGTLRLPGGDEIVVPIEAIRVDGRTATVCKYVCEPGLRSASELSRDREMRLCALWAVTNIAGCDRARMRWEFLGSGTSTECSAIRGDLDRALAETAEIVSTMLDGDDILPRESEHCRECPYVGVCPRMAHGLMLSEDPSRLSEDDGVRLVDEYADLQEKIDALRKRQELLEARRDVIAAGIVSYADANGYMAVNGHGYKALVRHERRVELPEDKSGIIARLRETGQYDAMSMPNYPRLRSDIAKGMADPTIAEMATVTD